MPRPAQELKGSPTGRRFPHIQEVQSFVGVCMRAGRAGSVGVHAEHLVAGHGLLQLVHAGQHGLEDTRD